MTDFDPARGGTGQPGQGGPQPGGDPGWAPTPPSQGGPAYGGSPAPQAGWTQDPGQQQAGWTQPTGPIPGQQQAGWTQDPGQPQAGWTQPTGAMPGQYPPYQGTDPGASWGQGEPAGPGYQQTGGYPPPGGYPGDQQGAPAGWPTSGQSPTPKKKHSGLIITVVAVVVALIAGAGVYFFAFRTSNTASGQSTPEAAVTALLTSLNQKDPVGVAAQLAPSEATLFADATGDILTQLKRLEIMTPAASPNDLTGTTVTVENPTFDAQAQEQINDHLTIVKLTGGTLTITTNQANIPLSDKIKQAIPDLDTQAKTQTINIGDEVAKSGHPIRLAAVKVNGNWYFSLFYTVADNWAQDSGAGNPTPADAIPAVGAASPEAAMTALVSSVTSGDYRSTIQLLDPNEMGVLHDYGGLILRKSGADIPKATGVTLSDESWAVTDVTGGKKVSLKSLTITTKDGQKITLERDPAAGSLKVAMAGEPAITVDASNLESFAAQAGGSIDPQLLTILQREFPQILGLGVVMVQDGGQWYVSPFRSFTDVTLSLLKGLEPADIDYFIQMANK